MTRQNDIAEAILVRSKAELDLTYAVWQIRKQ